MNTGPEAMRSLPFRSKFSLLPCFGNCNISGDLPLIMFASDQLLPLFKKNGVTYQPFIPNTVKPVSKLEVSSTNGRAIPKNRFVCRGILSFVFSL